MTQTGSDQGTDVEGWLSSQLHEALDRERGPRPRPAQALYQAAARNRRRKFVAIKSSIMATLGAKTAVGAAVVALGAGATAGTVATGSVNPVNWGQSVVQQVNKCKSEVGTGQSSTASSSRHNVGQCVSAVAQEHGEAVRAQHAESAESPSPGTHTTATPTPGAHSSVAASHANSAAAQGQSQAQAHGQGNPPTPGTSGQGSAGGHDQGRPTPSASPKG